MEPETTADPHFTFAFQPIVDAVARQVFSYEALIRGLANESAHSILALVPAERMLEFEQGARVRAIDLATQLGIGCHLNLNFIPQSLQSPTAVLATLEAANRAHFPVDRLILEITEGAVIDDHAQFAEGINKFRALGLMVAIDDFGAGYSGLNLLADFQPDQIKLDMKLIRGIDGHGPRQAIVRAIGQVCRDLGIDVIAEGVETVQEYLWLANAGFRLFQGFLFARPEFEGLPAVHYPELYLEHPSPVATCDHGEIGPGFGLRTWPEAATGDPAH